MKIKLINPSQLDALGRPAKLNREFVTGLTLPYLAALIPGDHDIEIVEESVEKIDFDEPVELVGITAITGRAPRAYWIAEQYRKRGVPVVMGGFHATALPHEALEHCDAVVKGEAEGIIEQVIEDAMLGKMHGIYERKEPLSLEGLPVPRYDLINMKNFFLPVHPVQASRGCPYNCDFCSVSAFFGSHNHRKRPIDDVIRDMQKAGPYILIIDDNLMADRRYALDLFAAMKPLGKAWIGQADIHSATDDELMEAAAETGCRMLYIGIETLDKNALAKTGKTPNLNTDIPKALMNLKRHHIETFASMIIGFDEDTPESGEKIVRFCNHMRIPILFLYILTPAPGSPMFKRMKEQGVPLKEGWHLYDGTHSVFDTASMKSHELETLYGEINRKVYSLSSILKRTIFPPHLLMVILNLWARKNIRNGLHPWMGDNRWEKLVDLIPRFGKPFMSPRIRKISKLVRFTEGRFSP